MPTTNNNPEPGKLLSLDEMISHFSQNAENSETVPMPWNAVSETLDPNPVVSGISLDALEQGETLIPDPNLATMVAQTPATKVSRPSAFKKLIPILGGFTIFVVLWFVVYLRYPDLLDFAALSTTDTPIEETIGWELEHGAALPDPETGGEEIDPELLPWEWLEETEYFPEIKREEIEIAETPDTIDPELLQITPDESITYIDLKAEEDDADFGDDFDPLNEVEKLVGSVDNTEAIKIEILDYQRRGEELLELGNISNDRNMRKYGSYIKSMTEKLLEDLASEEEFSISKWSEEKTKFEEYLDLSA